MVVAIAEPPPAVPNCRGAFDLPFLHLAVVGRANALVSGDSDLLALAGQVRFSSVTPGDFLKTLSASPT